MSKTVPEVRVNKNGVPVVKHVLADGAAAPVSAQKALPAPALAVGDPSARVRLPALRGKSLKEAKEMRRLAQNGDQKYEDTMTAFFLEDDIRSMRVYNQLTSGGEYSYPDSTLALGVMETAQRLGIGENDDAETFAGKCEALLDVIRAGGPVIGEDFTEYSYPHDDESDRFIRFIAENWEQSDAIMQMSEERGMEDCTVDTFIGVWHEFSTLPSPSLRDGVL